MERSHHWRQGATAALPTLALVAGLALVGPSGPVAAWSKAGSCNGVAATITGTPGDDYLVGTPGDDVIDGGDGMDDIEGGAGNDLICSGPSPYREVDGDEVFGHLSGGPGNDTLIGGSGSDMLAGGEGDDVLNGGGGKWDWLWGDDVDDTIGGADVLVGGAGPDEMEGGPGPDRLDGGSNDDYLSDLGGDNLLVGGDGDDVLASGPGADAVDGGSGVDWAHYGEVQVVDGPESHCHPITVDLDRGTASGTGFGHDQLQGVENVASGGGSDVLIGDGRANAFFPGQNCGRQQKEHVDGKGGIDRISFDGAHYPEDSPAGGVRVDLAEQRAQWRNWRRKVVRLSVLSIENVSGTSDRDLIKGSSGPNLLVGRSGLGDGDVIRGRGGPDVLVGGWGQDHLYGGRGKDFLAGRGQPDLLVGGPGSDRIDGGRGVDTCVSPRRGRAARDCER